MAYVRLPGQRLLPFGFLWPANSIRAAPCMAGMPQHRAVYSRVAIYGQTQKEKLLATTRDAIPVVVGYGVAHVSSGGQYTTKGIQIK
jgi:hypothetical protein